MGNYFNLHQLSCTQQYHLLLYTVQVMRNPNIMHALWYKPLKWLVYFSCLCDSIRMHTPRREKNNNKSCHRHQMQARHRRMDQFPNRHRYLQNPAKRQHQQKNPLEKSKRIYNSFSFFLKSVLFLLKKKCSISFNNSNQYIHIYKSLLHGVTLYKYRESDTEFAEIPSMTGLV